MFMQAEAASAFRCNQKFARKFERQDPLNPDNVVKGFICRKKGLMGGSLFITHVNDREVPPQLIYGTPKLAYPYNGNTRSFLNLKAHSFYLLEKWNGMNVLFFNYQDANGFSYLTCKSKGAPFLGDGEHGSFLTLCKEAMANLEIQCRVFSALGTTGAQSVSCELCGKKEPHLVEYDFDLDLKPLFTIHEHGKIKPVVAKGELPQFSEDIPQVCRNSQYTDFEINSEFRYERGLELKYEYNHFATEGKVLYLLNSDGFVKDRMLYKIKPPDTEEVHWATFNDDMKARVDEAIKKIEISEEVFTENNLQEELDMGPKEWSKFGRPVMKYCKEAGYVD